MDWQFFTFCHSIFYLYQYAKYISETKMADSFIKFQVTDGLQIWLSHLKGSSCLQEKCAALSTSFLQISPFQLVAMLDSSFAR
jgi:hypothetical protein